MGVDLMAALIEFVCTAAHERRSDPSITVEQKAWAYCPAGATDQHQWTRIDPTAIETLRSPAGNGHPHLAAVEPQIAKVS
jgi:hypothetical protein